MSIPTVHSLTSEPQGPLARLFLLFPQRDRELPEEIARLPYPTLLHWLRQARVALVRLAPERRYRGERTKPQGRFEVTVVELGPQGLDSYSNHHNRRADNDVEYRGGSLDVLKQWAARQGENVFGERTHNPDVAEHRRLVRAFLAELDEGALRAMRRARVNGCDDYNWLATGVRIIDERRQTAMLQFPALAHKMVKGNRRIEATLASGGSLAEALAVTYHKPRAMIRFLSGLPPVMARASRFSWNRDPGDLLDQLARTPAQAWPKGVRGWREWRFAWKVRQSFPHRAEHKFKELLDRLLADTVIRKDWYGDLTRMCARFGSEPVAAVSSVADPVRHLLIDVLGCGAITVGDTNANRIGAVFNSHCSSATRTELEAFLFRALAGDGGFKPLLQASLEWHQRAGRFVRMGKRERNGLADDTRLAHLVTEPVTIAATGHTFTPLLTAAAVRGEGTAMNHCIATYVDRALLGQIFVFHIDGPGLPEGGATCTLRRDTKDEETADNKAPLRFDALRLKDDQLLTTEHWPEGAVGLVGHLLAAIHGSQVWIDPQAMREYNRTRGLDGLRACPDLAGERANEAWAVWQPILPKRLRADSVAGALEGPFFTVGRALLRKSWMPEKRHALSAEKRRASLTKAAA